MNKKLTGCACTMHDSAVSENEQHLCFHGIVKDNNGLYVGNAIVLLLACFDNGIEKPLGYTFTDREGRYFIAIPKLSGDHKLLRYKLMASNNDIPGQLLNYPDNLLKETHQELEPDGQCSVTECAEEPGNDTYELYLGVSGQDKITKQVNVSLSADERDLTIIDLAMVDESENHVPISEGDIKDVLMSVPGKPMLNFTKTLKKSDLTLPTMHMLLLLTLFGFVFQKNVLPGYTNYPNYSGRIVK
ncbi:hypothetical protein SPSYN_02595 [Sporotomaculum syntrophicum]|uniref:Uncharacterized protein n=1 Tax=Sporotomaculum syntrophicum TaxID=182264 RepID=A0A9D3AXA0_9FIRM|nr:hypothetical protein [Sporotomaculum syntrophicum]KAF1084191.1 hypothetical protein SPSYN_02595 [Sporotomaculum syntrophicum]